MLRWGGGNQGEVRPATVYRSGQLSPSGLSRAIREHGIKTVLNLRGENPDQSWYRDERRTTVSEGATQIDFPMASDQWLSRQQLTGLIEILDHAEPPVLVHCEWGAERTGLTCAIAELLRPDGTIASARAQFSAYYLFLPIKDGLVMRGHLDRYARWLELRGEPHTPRAFREWAAHVYVPGRPSREYWPLQVYPIKVVSRPGRDRVAVWGEGARK